MYREITLEAEELGTAVARMCAVAEPLGAYASPDFVTYLFAQADNVLALRTQRTTPERAIAAVAGEIPLFDWHEREMRDTHDVALTGSPNGRALFIRGGSVPRALEAEGKGVSLIVVGPVHAGIIEPGRFTFSTGGETVIHLDAQLSYSRRGIQAFLVGADALDAAPRVARICAACSAARSWAYARALEELAGVTCAEPAEWARVVVAELERIYNHIFDLASSAAGAGFGHGQVHGLELKERVHRVCAAAAGHRLLFDAIVPGGVRTGVLEQPATIRAQAARLADDVAAFCDALFANRSLASRFAGTGRVRASTAQAFGAVGPARRACGSDLDMRRSVPYGAYRVAPPDAVSESAGDVAARCAVKRREIANSFALIDRALSELGHRAPPAPPRMRVGRGVVTTVVEGPRGCESISVECDRHGRLALIHVISASYRNWPVVVRAMEENIVPDFPLVNKSFNLCYACADR